MDTNTTGTLRVVCDRSNDQIRLHLDEFSGKLLRSGSVTTRTERELVSRPRYRKSATASSWQIPSGGSTVQPRNSHGSRGRQSLPDQRDRSDTPRRINCG
jgi:hypothetical protein